MSADMENSRAMTHLEVGHACDIGMVRDLNEDRVLILDLSAPDASLFAVADGVGGCEGGEIASELALEAMIESISKVLAVTAPEGLSEGRDQNHLRLALAEGVKKANRMVFEQGQKRGSSMGTTMVAALVCGSSVHIANVGDSRAYLLEHGELRQATEDHSMVAALVAAGLITHDELYTHPQRNIITRSVGMGPDLEVDLFALELVPDSSLLLCSDGLWEMVRDDDIKAILRESPRPQIACDELVKLANRNGGRDNISAVVVRNRLSGGTECQRVDA